MCPGPWTIWTDRTVHPVPKRYHGAGLTIGQPVRRALHDRKPLSRQSDSDAQRREEGCFAWNAATPGLPHPAPREDEPS